MANGNSSSLFPYQFSSYIILDSSAAPIRSFLQAAKTEEVASPLRVVQMEGLAVLKLIKHCSEYYPSMMVTGQLLGLDVGSVLEVTNCFPFLENIKRCVCIIYDPSKSCQGVLSLKAIKLSDSFMELYRSNNFSGEKLREKNLSWGDMFEEIPIKVSNSPLVSAVMTQLESDSPVTQCDYDRLQLSSAPYLEKSLELIIQSIDDLSMHQQTLQKYYRHVARQQSQQPNQWGCWSELL